MRRPYLPFVALLALACSHAAPAEPPATPVAPAPASPSAAPAGTETSPDATVLDAPDRDPDDKKLDAGRHPLEMLAFFGVAPGMKVAEISSGGGYTTEFLARRVGESGKVFGQNSPFILQRFAEKPWSARLAKPVMKNVVRVDREFDDPLPPEAHDLDVVLDVLFYHDTVWMKTDRDKMNKAIFAALKPGGIYGVVDHSGRAGTGLTEVETLHRIEEKVEREEIERAGFKLVAEGTFLKNANDARDWSASPRVAGERRGTSDRFVLKFQKP